MNNKQLEINDLTRIADYNKLLSEYGQDLQDTRTALRKACRCLTYYTNCFKLINNSAVVNELCGKFNSCTDCLFEYFLKKSKEEHANGD